MNERDAYQLARAFAEVKESRRRGYEYACVSVQAVRALTAEPKCSYDVMREGRRADAQPDGATKQIRCA